MHLKIELSNKESEQEWRFERGRGFGEEEFGELDRHIEYPAIYHKARIRGHQQAARPDESEEQRKERDRREFLALQVSPFFDVWACAGIDETLSALYEKMVGGDS